VIKWQTVFDSDSKIGYTTWLVALNSLGAITWASNKLSSSLSRNRTPTSEDVFWLAVVLFTIVAGLYFVKKYIERVTDDFRTQFNDLEFIAKMRQANSNGPSKIYLISKNPYDIILMIISVVYSVIGSIWACKRYGANGLNELLRTHKVSYDVIINIILFILFVTLELCMTVKIFNCLKNLWKLEYQEKLMP
jgi:hypothetical protein